MTHISNMNIVKLLGNFRTYLLIYVIYYMVLGIFLQIILHVIDNLFFKFLLYNLNGFAYFLRFFII